MKFFSQIETLKLSLKNAWLQLIFFSDSNNPCRDLFFPRSYKRRKNISLLAGTTVKKPDFLGPSRDA